MGAFSCRRDPRPGAHLALIAHAHVFETRPITDRGRVGSREQCLAHALEEIQEPVAARIVELAQYVIQQQQRSG